MYFSGKEEDFQNCSSKKARVGINANHAAHTFDWPLLPVDIWIITLSPINEAFKQVVIKWNGNNSVGSFIIRCKSIVHCTIKAGQSACQSVVSTNKISLCQQFKLQYYLISDFSCAPESRRVESCIFKSESVRRVTKIKYAFRLLLSELFTVLDSLLRSWEGNL